MTRHLRPSFLAIALTAASSLVHTASAAPEEVQGEERAVLADAPAVPPPLKRKHATRVVIHLEVKEVVQRLADGVDFTFWTFGGHVPGKFIRIREGDLVEFHLDNHSDNKMPHNIDLHAVNGPGGGASSSFTAPGRSSVFSFKALNPGLYVYHCATAPVGMHIGNGMYGLILVEPKEGLPKVDREYYVMQGEIYTKGANGQPGLQPFSMAKAIAEQPEYVVFNGAVGALSDDKALEAKPGERVRIFVGNGGPNLISSFHVIGEIFESVRMTGQTTAARNEQTVTLSPGRAATVEMKFDVPGTYIMVDHSITRAFNKGAMAQIKVKGREKKDVFSGKIRDDVYLPEGSRIQTVEQGAPGATIAKSKAERMDIGKRVFETNCIACHQANGQGMPGAFPPLAKSDFLNADVDRAIKVVTGGLTGKVTVNGNTYDSVMPAWHLSDEEIAGVLTYVYNSWGNSGHDVTAAEVKAKRVPAGKGTP